MANTFLHRFVSGFLSCPSLQGTKLATTAPRLRQRFVSTFLTCPGLHGVSVIAVAWMFRHRLVSDVERHFGHDHKTLNRMLERANLVTIGHLQRAGTLAHDRELAKTGRLSREQIARLLGFDSSKHLAEMWRTAKRSGLVRAGEIVVFLD